MFAKLTESNNKYYSCCVIYSNSARYLNILNNFKGKNEGFAELSKKVVFYENAQCFNDYQTKIKLS